jgi:CRISPR/Cas system-associated protein Cas10 (large subunit of type III CRISPR-Cas system)
MRKDWSEEEIEFYKDCINQGLRYAEIGKLLNRTKDSVRNFAAKINYKFEDVNPPPIFVCGENEKRCSLCKTCVDVINFNKNKGRKDGLNSVCKDCSRKRSKQYYTDNKEIHKKETSRRGKIHKLERRKKIFDYLKEHPCVDCGETNPIVLEFDHRELEEKEYTISQIIDKRGWNIVLNEIAKCDVRCANCHRMRTAKQFGWYKGLI